LAADIPEEPKPYTHPHAAVHHWRRKRRIRKGGWKPERWEYKYKGEEKEG
jgi:hypothetical protein